MPTDRIDFEAAVVNDQLYVIGGCTEDNFGYTNKQFSTNERYTPVGYDTAATTSPTSSDVTPNAIRNETSTSPSELQRRTQPELPEEIFYGIATVVGVVAVTVAVFVLRKAHRPKILYVSERDERVREVRVSKR